MTERVAATGISRSIFGVCSDVTIQELAFEAVKNALEDAIIEGGTLDDSI